MNDYFKGQYEANIKDSRKLWAVSNKMLKRKTIGKEKIKEPMIERNKIKFEETLEKKFNEHLVSITAQRQLTLLACRKFLYIWLENRTSSRKGWLEKRED